jgi:hypothetical protein
MINFEEFKPERFGYVRGEDIAKLIVKWACLAKRIEPIAKSSIRIMAAAGTSDLDRLYDVADDERMFTDMVSRGTPLINALAFMAHGKDRKFREYFKIVEGMSSSSNEYLLEANNKMALFLTLVLTRGSVPKLNAATTPIPRLFKDMKGISGINSEGEFAKALCDFDLAQLDFAFVLSSDLPGMDQIFLNRINLAMAGHKPLKISSDYQGFFVGETETNQIALSLSKLLANKHQDNMWFPRLHPLHKQRVTDKYKGFYKSCIFAIYIALGGDDIANHRMKTHGALRPDRWVQSEDMKSFTPTYHIWDLTQLAKDIGDPRQFGNLDTKGKGAESISPVESPVTSDPGITTPKSKDPTGSGIKF